MAYLIDGNNLAGRLGILKEAGFDTKLIHMVAEFCEKNDKQATLVFDSADILGDRFTEGPVTVIYTPRDAIYENADDKIVELMQAEESAGGWIVVTDDNYLLDKADDMGADSMFAREFMKNLLPPEEIELLDDEAELGADEKEEINDELMEEWGG